MSSEMLVLADQLKAARDRKKALEEETKAENQKIEKLEAELAAEMTSEEMQNFSRQGHMFYLQTKVRASANAESKQDLFDWLKENGYGDMVQEQVNANTLSAFIKEQMEETEALPEDLAPLVNVFEKVTVGIRKAK